MEKDILEIVGLSKKYSSFQIKNLSFELKRNSITGIVGETGSGKSTILRIAAGIVHCDAGEIIYNGEKIKNGTYHPEIGYVLSRDDIYPSVRLDGITGFVKHGCGHRWNQEKYEYYLHEVFLLDSKKKCRDLSAQERLFYFLTLELAKEPSLILLDEPTFDLDITEKAHALQAIGEVFRKEDLTAVLSARMTEDIQMICDHMIYLEMGNLLLSDEKQHIQKEYIKVMESFYKDIDYHTYGVMKNMGFRRREMGHVISDRKGH